MGTYVSALDGLRPSNDPGGDAMTTTESVTTDSDGVISLLLALSEFGRLVTDVLVEVTGDRDIVRNSPIITLAVLVLEGPQRPGDLRQRTGLTSGGVTKLLQRLEGDGLVERQAGAIPEDRRAVRVTITRSGRRMLHDVADRFGERLGDVNGFAHDASRLVDDLRQAVEVHADAGVA